MPKLLHIGLIPLLALLLSPAEATCGQCYTAHTCTSNTTFQLCYNGVPDTAQNFTCPSNKPICTEYGDICMASGAITACGDTSSCGQCSNGETYACASRTTFGRCDEGVLQPERSACPTDWFCSVSGAAGGDPCVLICEPDNADTCDRVENNSSMPIPDPDPITTTTSDTNDNSTDTTTTDSTTTDSTTTDSTTTDTTTTTPGAEVDASAYCQGVQKAGRFAIPNDTVCSSFINCFYRASTWQGTIVVCPTAKPYFNAINACGTVKPTTAGCL